MNTQTTTSNIAPFRQWILNCGKVKAYVLPAPRGEWRGKCFCCITFDDGVYFEGDMLQRTYPTHKSAVTDVQFTVRRIFESTNGNPLEIPTEDSQS
jgi:hypothetical protein